MDEWERQLVQDVRQALLVVNKFGTPGRTVLRLHFKKAQYTGLRLEVFETRPTKD